MKSPEISEQNALSSTWGTRGSEPECREPGLPLPRASLLLSQARSCRDYACGWTQLPSSLLYMLWFIMNSHLSCLQFFCKCDCHLVCSMNGEPRVRTCFLLWEWIEAVCCLCLLHFEAISHLPGVVIGSWWDSSLLFQLLLLDAVFPRHQGQAGGARISSSVTDSLCSKNLSW